MNRSLRRQGVVHAGRGIYCVQPTESRRVFVVRRLPVDARVNYLGPYRSELWFVDEVDRGQVRRSSPRLTARDAIRDILRWTR